MHVAENTDYRYAQLFFLRCCSDKKEKLVKKHFLLFRHTFLAFIMVKTMLYIFHYVHTIFFLGDKDGWKCRKLCTCFACDLTSRKNERIWAQLGPRKRHVFSKKMKSPDKKNMGKRSMEWENKILVLCSLMPWCTVVWCPGSRKSCWKNSEYFALSCFLEHEESRRLQYIMDEKCCCEGKVCRYRHESRESLVIHHDHAIQFLWWTGQCK